MGKKIANVRHNPYLMGDEVDYRHVPEEGLRMRGQSVSKQIAAKRGAICRVFWRDRCDVKARTSFKDNDCKAPAIPEDNSNGRKAERDDER